LKEDETIDETVVNIMYPMEDDAKPPVTTLSWPFNIPQPSFKEQWLSSCWFYHNMIIFHFCPGILFLGCDCQGASL
jgi:hypothetical protein